MWYSTSILVRGRQVYLCEMEVCVLNSRLPKSYVVIVRNSLKWEKGEQLRIDSAGLWPLLTQTLYAHLRAHEWTDTYLLSSPKKKEKEKQNLNQSDLFKAMGLERWLNSWEHMLFFQKTWFQSLAPTLQLRTVCNCSYRGLGTFTQT